MRIRRVLFLALFGFLATANPFGGQMFGVTSNESAFQTAQNPAPPPPECGLYDICKGTAKV